MTWLTIMEYLCHKWLRVFSVCRSNHNPALSSFMIYHWIFKKSNTTGANDRAGMVRIPEFTFDYSGVPSFIYSSILLSIVCLFVLFLFLVIVLSGLLRTMFSEYPFWYLHIFFLYFIWLEYLRNYFTYSSM